MSTSRTIGFFFCELTAGNQGFLAVKDVIIYIVLKRVSFLCQGEVRRIRSSSSGFL